MKYFIKITLFGLLLVFSIIKDAYAYLDPGTGSILLQGLVAAIGGALIWFGAIRRAIVSFFQRIFSGPNKAKSETESNGNGPK